MRKGLLAVLAVLGLPASAQAAEPDFHRCRDAAAGARCGHVGVPLDRLAPAGERIRIGFELYRRRDRGRPALGTMVAVEGGPGYSSTDSRDYFLELARPLMDRRDLLLVDARGTGLSGPLDCPALRRTVAGYIRRAGRCAAQLGPRVDRYTTRASVDDLADVLDALGIGAVDLYGDSYGSYFGQAFAVNHPDRLRSLVLDGTYPLPGTDPALGDLAEATWRALRLVCARRPSCAARGEDPRAVLQRIADRVRARPVRGIGTDGEGARIRVRLDIAALATLVQSGYGNLPMYRDLVAAIRAFEDGDRAPLLRLVAETTLVPEASPVRWFSDPLYLAVTCHDYPQMWDPAAPLATRRQQLAAARAALPPAQFAPFTATEWTSLPYEGATACLRWPGPRRPEPPVDPQAPYPAVPTLVVNGDLDNITTTDQARVVASRFPSSTYVETRNTVHVSALGDRDGCAAPIVRRFIRTLRAGDTSCAGGSPRCARSTASRAVPPAPRRPTRGRATAAPWPTAGSPPSRRPRWPTRSSAGCSTTAAVPRPARRALDLERRPPHALPLQRRALHPRRPGVRQRDLATRDRRGPRRPPDPRPGPAASALERAPPARDGHAHRPARRTPPAGDDARALNDDAPAPGVYSHPTGAPACWLRWGDGRSPDPPGGPSRFARRRVRVELGVGRSSAFDAARAAAGLRPITSFVLARRDLCPRSAAATPRPLAAAATCNDKVPAGLGGPRFRSPGRVVGARALHRGNLTHGGEGEGVSGVGGAAGCDGDGHGEILRRRDVPGG